MLPENCEVLSRGLEKLGLELEESQVERLLGYHDLLMQRNRDLNLTGIRDESDSVLKNLLNALAPWRQVYPTKVSCDVGSGGGLPGLPLSIALNMPSMTLVESKAKKCRFLEEAVKEFSPKTNVLCANIAEIEKKYDQIIVCAFGTLEKILRFCQKRLSRGGRILAYKGTREKIDEELKTLENWEIIPFSVPGMEDAQRHLCVFRRDKVVKTH